MISVLGRKNSCVSLKATFSSNPLGKTVYLKCVYDEKIRVVFFTPFHCFLGSCFHPECTVRSGMAAVDDKL